MRFTKAKYILRFDDICPTMNWKMWEVIEKLLIQNNVRPILAVIPDVKDPLLLIDQYRVDFWDKVKEWKARGWTIALHGYQHLFVTRDTGAFSKSCSYSEFAGLPYTTQKEKIEKALEIFRTHGLNPDLWIAPASSFDMVTLHILKEFGITLTCCGFYLRPVKINEVIFLPQQLWWFRWVPFGLWTIVFHHNFWDNKKLRNFEKNLDKYKPFLISVEEALKQFKVHEIHYLDKLFANFYAGVVKIYSFCRKVI